MDLFDVPALSPALAITLLDGHDNGSGMMPSQKSKPSPPQLSFAPTPANDSWNLHTLVSPRPSAPNESPCLPIYHRFTSSPPPLDNEPPRSPIMSDVRTMTTTANTRCSAEPSLSKPSMGTRSQGSKPWYKRSARPRSSTSRPPSRRLPSLFSALDAYHDEDEDAPNNDMFDLSAALNVLAGPPLKFPEPKPRSTPHTKSPSASSIITLKPLPLPITSPPITLKDLWPEEDESASDAPPDPPPKNRVRRVKPPPLPSGVALATPRSPTSPVSPLSFKLQTAASSTSCLVTSGSTSLLPGSKAAASNDPLASHPSHQSRPSGLPRTRGVKNAPDASAFPASPSTPSIAISPPNELTMPLVSDLGEFLRPHVQTPSARSKPRRMARPSTAPGRMSKDAVGKPKRVPPPRISTLLDPVYVPALSDSPTFTPNTSFGSATSASECKTPTRSISHVSLTATSRAFDEALYKPRGRVNMNWDRGRDPWDDVDFDEDLFAEYITADIHHRLRTMSAMTAQPKKATRPSTSAGLVSSAPPSDSESDAAKRRVLRKTRSSKLKPERPTTATSMKSVANVLKTPLKSPVPLPKTLGPVVNENEFKENEKPTMRDLFEASLIPIWDQNGKVIQFGKLFENQVTIVVFIRHFWCPMCQDYMKSIVKDMNPWLLERAKAKLVVIGCGDPAMIRSYNERMFRSPFELYVDPRLELHKVLGMTRKTLDAGPEKEKGEYVRHGTLTGTLTAIGRAVTTMSPSVLIKKGGDVKQLGGEFVIGPGLRCRYAHRMTTTRSHTPILQVAQEAGVDLATPLPPPVRAFPELDARPMTSEDEEDWMTKREAALRGIQTRKNIRRYSAFGLSRRKQDIRSALGDGEPAPFASQMPLAPVCDGGECGCPNLNRELPPLPLEAQHKN